MSIGIAFPDRTLGVMFLGTYVKLRNETRNWVGEVDDRFITFSDKVWYQVLDKSNDDMVSSLWNCFRRTDV